MLGHAKDLLYRVKHLIGGQQPTSKLPPSYYMDDICNRDILINDVYKKIDSGVPWLEAIRTPRAASHGERVAEYAFIASLLKELNPASILDVGCVLNNPVISDMVSRNSSSIFFLNPSLEPVCYQKYGYFKFPLASWNTGWTFPLVTCLSTIEHIGFDNTRYGVDEIDQGWDWPRCIDEVVSSIRNLYSMTASGGTMLVSCPFGREEFVLHPPETGVRTAQVLHAGHVEALRKVFDNRLEIITLRLSSNGWELAEPDAVYQSYGEVGPGASGLIFVYGKRV